MSEEEYISAVSETNADIEPFIRLAMENADFRAILVRNLLMNDRINVYYHSYQILSEVAQSDPGLLFGYWDDFTGLLNHRNSYHRNYGMDLISCLISDANDQQFEEIFESYYNQLEHEKISTKKYCITYTARVIKGKPHHSSRIITKIINYLQQEPANQKHRNLLISEFIKILESAEIYLSVHDIIENFFRKVYQETGSRRVTKEIDKLMSRYGLPLNNISSI